MANIFDVAKYILSKEGTMSTWKLEKLCYYSQAWSLAWTDKPLFQEEFEAWVNGPVCYDLFSLHKGKFTISADELSKGKASNLNKDDKETVDIVLNHYGKMEPYELRELSHSETPWKEARGKTPEGVPSSAIITKESMGAYYGSL